MKWVVTFWIVLISTFSAFSQSMLQSGDKCFGRGDYACAQIEYKKAMRAATGKNRQVAEIKFTQAKWCEDKLRAANEAFRNKSYTQAKSIYEKVCETNPNDAFAKLQLDKCTRALTPVLTLSVSRESISFLSSGGSERVSVTTNANAYSLGGIPAWCKVQKYAGYFTIVCDPNPAAAERIDYFTVSTGNKFLKVNLNQAGTPQKVETTLSATAQNLSFPATGGISEEVKVYSNAATYSTSLVPSWCSVQPYNGYFVVSCTANYSTQPRSDWFMLSAGDKDIRVYVSQLGYTVARRPIDRPDYGRGGTRNRCFNCPKRKDTWGVTAGYTQLKSDSVSYLDGVQLGFRIEPLFKYGFGLNTGIIFEGYSNNRFSEVNVESIEQYALNVPLHLEYRFNFSKLFTMFAYGGAGFNYLGNFKSDEYSLPVTYDYGAGFRVSHVQFNIERSFRFGDFRDTRNFGKNSSLFRNFVISMSYMF